MLAPSACRVPSCGGSGGNSGSGALPGPFAGTGPPRGGAASDGSAALCLVVPPVMPLPAPAAAPPLSEVSRPAYQLPDTSRTADPDTLRYRSAPPSAALIAENPWMGVIVSTSSAPYRAPSGEETDAPASGPATALPPSCTRKPIVSTLVRLTYSSKEIVIVRARRSIDGPPARSGALSSSTTLSVALDRPAKCLPCSGAKTLWAMSMASAPPPACSAASRAFCGGASVMVTLGEYRPPAAPASAPSRPTRSRPSGDAIAMPARSDGTATPLSKRIARVPLRRSRTGFGPPPPPPSPASTG